jgi:hypothetical protein
MGIPAKPDTGDISDEQVEEGWHAVETILKRTATDLASRLRKEALPAIVEEMENAASRLENAFAEIVAKEGIKSDRPMSTDASFALRFKAARLRQRERDRQASEIRGYRQEHTEVEGALRALDLQAFFPNKS